MFEIEIIPVLQDNYNFLVHSPTTQETAVVDPSEAVLILSRLQEKRWNLTHILNTHHHSDHIGGNKALKEQTGCTIVGFKGDAHRIPGIDIELEDGEVYAFGGQDAQIMHLPGHTLGIITYYFAQEQIAFVGDTLFAMGCGRLFEGTPEQMYHSLKKLAALPDETVIYCAHEYTLNNAEFSLTVESNNEDLQRRYEEVKEMRSRGMITIPTTIGLEKKTNPFLRANSLEEFTRIRQLKDVF